MKRLIYFLHRTLLYNTLGRQQNINLVENLQHFFPEEPATVLDVGCGDGIISHLLHEKRADLTFSGIEVVARDSYYIPCEIYDGTHMPFSDGQFDYVMLINVLHHCEDPDAVMEECRRVCKKGIILKDHYCESKVDFLILAFGDIVGPGIHGINQPFNFKSKAEWKDFLEKHHLREEKLQNSFSRSYNWLVDLVFNRGLHFIGRYSKTS